jgi:hypothetical protein
MTMKRGTKAQHQEAIDTARTSRTRRTGVQIESPIEIAKRGRTNMTESDYRELRMGRGSRQEDVARDFKGTRTHTHRQVRVY